MKPRWYEVEGVRHYIQEIDSPEKSSDLWFI